MATQQDTKERIVAHTPGPWTVYVGETNDGSVGAYGSIEGCTDGADSELFLATVWADVRALQEQAEGNANLIAAAPDLLAVCRRFLEMYDDVRKSVGPSVLAAIEHAERAIAKAEGRS